MSLSIALVSLLYVFNEFSFDNFHEKKARIYRLIVNTESAVEGTESSSIMTAGVGPSFLQNVPEIEAMARVSNPQEGLLIFEEQHMMLKSVIYADSSFFNIFSFDLLLGNPETALQKPFSIILTKSLARKIFENENNALGNVLRFNDKDNYMVTGIVDDPPINSHLTFESILSFVSLYQDPQMYLGWNGGWNYLTYFLLHKGVDFHEIENQFVAIAEENINAQMRDIGVSWNFYLQPLQKIHLNTDINWDIDTKGSRTNLILLIVITFIILLIACINFVNLTMASILTRLKEVGIRKVAGADRHQIIAQFLIESILVSLLALILAILLIEFIKTIVFVQFGDIIFLEIFELSNRSYWQVAATILFLLLAVGFIAGIYPALYMSKFHPALAVKGKIRIGKSSPLVRNLLIVFQFTISTMLIICTLVIVSQLDFLLTSDKGFNPMEKIVVALPTESARHNVDELKKAFLSLPGVESAGSSSQIPGNGYTQNGYFPEGFDKPLMFHALDIDCDYLSAMGLEMVQGRNFSKEFGQDNEAYIINQALAKQLGWENPIGKKISRDGDHTIIGVVNDFNFSTLHDNIEPLIITSKPWRGFSYLTLRISGKNDDLMASLEKEWNAIVPYENFVAFSLDTYITKAYGEEKKAMIILLFCSFISIFIASLGLFGLSAFSTRRRFKEIAVRKVFGAGINKIFILVSSGFLKWVLMANIIGWPLAYFIMDNYFLSNFAYNGGIKWWIFLAALLFTVTLSLFVIVFQIIRLGRLNPIDYIRYE